LWLLEGLGSEDHWYAGWLLLLLLFQGYGEVALGPAPSHPPPISSVDSDGGNGRGGAALAQQLKQKTQLAAMQQLGTATAADLLADAASSAVDPAPVAAAEGGGGQQVGPAAAKVQAAAAAVAAAEAAAMVAAGGDDVTSAAEAVWQQSAGPGHLHPLLQGSCPFPATPLPLSPAEIGGDGSMFSTYLHEAIPNCILWGLHQSGGLHTTVQDGTIPQLRLITDLFGGLIPELPKHYPKKGMLMDIVMTEPPQVQFRTSPDGSVILSARYDTNVSVLDAAGDGAALLVAQLTANVSVAADFGWTQTMVHGTNVSYAVLWEMYPVNVNGWNMIIDWVVKQAGPKQSLGQLWDTYVKTAATPYLALDNVTTAATDQWFVVSSDVKVLQLPPLLAAVAGGGGDDASAVPQAAAAAAAAADVE
jgi:hypothetical protein